MNTSRPIQCLKVIISALVMLTGQAVYGQGNTQNPDVVRVGYTFEDLAAVDPTDARVAIELWQQKLSDLTPEQDFGPENSYFESMSSLVSALERGEIDGATIPSVDYIRSREKLPVVPILVPIRNEEVLDTYILLVRGDGGLTDLPMLKDKDLTIEEGVRGRIALLWLDTLLLERGMSESKAFLGSVRTVKKGSQAVLPVFFGQTDACIVTLDAWNTLCELNPQLKKQLHLAEQSPGYLGGLFVMRTDFPLQSREKFIRNTLSVQAKPECKQILTLFRFNGLIEYRPSYIKTLETLVKQNDGLKRKKNNQGVIETAKDVSTNKKSTEEDHSGESGKTRQK